MRLRFLASCLAVLITASTGFCQDATGEPAEPIRLVSPDPNAPTPARDIQLLNPDGTPATDAKVVAVLTTPGGMVDQDLKPRQVRKGDRQPLFELANTNGTVKIIFDSTQAIVASNEQGFLFLPASAFADRAKLRKWARVELDVSTVPDDLRADITLNVTWTNSLQGMYVRPQMNQGDDPFRSAFDRPEEMEPKLDWRFDPMITWTQSVPVTNRSVRVPPGEVMISLVSKQVKDETPFLVLPPGACAATVGLWQTPSGSVQHVVLPEFGTVAGAIKTDTTSTLPDWSHSGSETMQFSLNHGPFADLPPILSPSGSNDEYFSNLASDEGFKARREWAASSMTTSSDNSFRFPLVPVGTYSIHKLIQTWKLPVGIQGHPAVVTVPLKQDGDNPSVVVNAKNTTVVSVTELRQPAFVPESLPEIPRSGSPGPLPTGAEVAFRESRRMVDGREVTQVIPYVVYPQQGMPKDPIMLPSAPRANAEVEKWVDPAQLFSPDIAPAPDQKTDAATTLIQNWLRSAKDPSDQAELRKLLQDHLQQEFEVTQASRKAEVERLQKLLEKSVEWLDDRAKKRDEIIQKRIDELIQTSVGR